MSHWGQRIQEQRCWRTHSRILVARGGECESVSILIPPCCLGAPHAASLLRLNGQLNSWSKGNDSHDTAVTGEGTMDGRSPRTRTPGATRVPLPASRDVSPGRPCA